MGAMRQRFLLVAGWVIAAVATSLVAAGAVAVAGGQVTDRPLRPLTAAEVAALPVAQPVDAPAEASALPPAVSSSEREQNTAGKTVDAPGSDNEPGPVGDEGTLVTTTAATADAGDAPPGPTLDESGSEPGGEPASRDDPTASPPQDEPTSTAFVEHLRGGSVSVAAGNDGLLLLWARPKPGFVMDAEFESDHELHVEFSNEGRGSILTAQWTGTELIVETDEVDR